MALTAGRLVKRAAGGPSGGQQSMVDAIPFGWADLCDSGVTNLNYTGGSGFVKVPNNLGGTGNITTYLPDGVTSAVFNGTTGRFSFTELAVGDMISLEVDLEVTTAAANQEIDLIISLGIGSAGATSHYILSPLQIKSASTREVTGHVTFPIRDTYIRDYAGEVQISSANNLTVKTKCWHLQIFRRF